MMRINNNSVMMKVAFAVVVIMMMLVSELQGIELDKMIQNTRSVTKFQGLGDRLTHTFFSKTPIPLNESAAVASNEWKLLDGARVCHEYLGIPYINNRVIVYYTNKGQLSGFGVQLHEELKNGSTVPGFWTKLSKDRYQIDIATRDPKFACSLDTDIYGGPIGDRLIVQPGKLNFEIPLTDKLATARQFIKGACISGMGTHFGYDVYTAPHLSGWSKTLVPVIPMYHEGQVSAVLFYSHSVQECYPIGQWEGPFIPWLFCKNFCSDDCMKHESSLTMFTTMHFLFHDADLNTCPERCPGSGKTRLH
ncbi:hypothetical protein NAEGRDRAFT_60085 [Naegleria gruberi]|uniref:Uncharacterized protein n=1 Tax=Naegleria gruberi TaxID=5762 RepID=D2W5U3_NAEGR|nr:uncharacterized protein NAEGRDRAFT_60085 [Naegleria gruberi]EFC35561.1 hypothetical protein NAEGRDRAFT_60085 [Naegleria gruberi]|eukprot:XP_002668305.1 hypothetical protein NAEGRDRAFT_60085 [Naegleria gruberi strain NEG-M]